MLQDQRFVVAPVASYHYLMSETRIKSLFAPSIPPQRRKWPQKLKFLQRSSPLHLLLVVALASAENDVIPDDFGLVDEWMKLNVRSFDDRMAEAQASLGKPLVDAEQNKRVITVSQDGSGHFKTVTDAVNSDPKDNTDRIIVKIGPGVYKEKITVDR
ncbi:hypothetical protein ACLOJK_025834 [Asimina triloba]